MTETELLEILEEEVGQIMNETTRQNIEEKRQEEGRANLADKDIIYYKKWQQSV